LSLDYAKPHAVILVFGNLQADGQVIKADNIYRTLETSRAWYLPRGSGALKRTTRFLFYQNGSGLRGVATLKRLDPIDSTDRINMKTLGIEYFRVKLIFDSWRTFATPISLRPLVGELEFISNKKYWGHSLRGGPRPIGEGDFNVIMRNEQVPLLSIEARPSL
jgi:hypothetical protein